MKLGVITQNRFVKLVTESFNYWMEDKALRLAAALAYYSVFSIAPILVIAISMAGLIFGEEAVKGQLNDQLSSVVGAQAAEAVQTMVQSAAKPKQGWIGTVVGFVVLLIGASGFFGQLKDALNTIWEVQAKKGSGIKGLIRERLLNFGMVLVIGFMLLTSLVLTTAIAALNKFLGSALGVPTAVWAVVAFVISLALVTGLFAVIFKVLPDAKVHWKNVWVGAIVTALLFELGKFGLSIYLGRESTASTYGAAASVVLLLLWVYYASCILLFGAEFTQVYAKATGHVIKPEKNAEAVSPETRAQQGLKPESKDAEPPAGRPVVTTIPVPALEPGPVWEPAGALLFTTALSFAAGLALRRLEAQAQAPKRKIREGLSELGHQKMAELAEALQHGGKKARGWWS